MFIVVLALVVDHGFILSESDLGSHICNRTNTHFVSMFAFFTNNFSDFIIFLVQLEQPAQCTCVLCECRQDVIDQARIQLDKRMLSMPQAIWERTANRIAADVPECGPLPCRMFFRTTAVGQRAGDLGAMRKRYALPGYEHDIPRPATVPPSQTYYCHILPAITPTG
jgi:hypothetical protein